MTGYESSFEPEPGDAPRRWQLRPLSEVTARQTRWLVHGQVPLRYLTLVAAIGGVGKSHHLIALASQGSVAAEPWDTIYVSFEDGAEEVLRPRVEAAGGDTSRVHELALTDADSLASFSLPSDVEELQVLVRECRARLVVIDPIVASIETKLDAYKDQHVRQVLAQLWRVAREEDCALAMAGHLNRVPSTDAYLRIANSMAFWNAARSVILITPEGDEDDGLRLIAQRKANLARLAPVERHVLEEVVLPDTLDPETGQRLVTSRLRFLEVADDINPSEVLGPQKATKTATAETLLEALLAEHDWRESEGVRKLMAAAGFPERTTQRAAKDLGVESDRRGFPSVTWWRLPVAPSLGPEVGATVDSALRSRLEVLDAPVAPTRAEREGGATDAFECIVCDREYELDEEHPERLRCPACVAGVSA